MRLICKELTLSDKLFGIVLYLFGEDFGHF